jgi:stress response protein YsnF
VLAATHKGLTAAPLDRAMTGIVSCPHSIDWEPRMRGRVYRDGNPAGIDTTTKPTASQKGFQQLGLSAPQSRSQEVAVSNQPHTSTDNPAEERLQLVEETLCLGKKRVVTGTVRVRTVTEEVPVSYREMLASETVEVERVPIGKVIDAVPEIREIDGVTIIPVVEERVRVVRELVLVEEVRMRRVRSEALFETTGSRRIMHAVVERQAAPPQDAK